MSMFELASPPRKRARACSRTFALARAMGLPLQEPLRQIEETPGLGVPTCDAVRCPLDRRVNHLGLLVADHEMDHHRQGLLPLLSLRHELIRDLLRRELEEG